MADNLQNKAVEQAVNYFQVSELQFIIFCLLILVLWFIGTYYLQSRFQKNVMKDIALQKEEIEKRLKNIDYKNDYYKKIIDKRMTAYEYLEFVISKIEVIQEIFDDYGLKQGEGKNIYSCFMNKEMLAETCENIISVSKYDLWLSNEVRIKLSEINLIIANALTSINCPNKRNLEFYGLNIQKDNNDKLSIKIGIYEYKKMSKLINEVRTIMAKDIKTLDEIVPFFDNLLKK